VRVRPDRLMAKRKRHRSLYKRVVDRDGKRQLGQVKSIAQKLLAELDMIELSDAGSTAGAMNFYKEVRRFEKELIIQALMRSDGHQLRAARLLNLNPSTLKAKIKKYNIQSTAFSKSKETNGKPHPPRLRVLK